MRTNWEDAPEWAEFLAMDSDGNWYWHEFRPEWNGEEWLSDGEIRLSTDTSTASTSLEWRP